MRHYLLLLLLWSLSSTVSAQYYEVYHITESDGLLNDNVYSLYQDSISGVLFAAHPSGISRIYGRHIETIPIAENKSSSDIYPFEYIKGEMFYHQYKILADEYERIDLPDKNIAIQITHTETEIDTLPVEVDAYRDSRGHYWLNVETEEGDFELMKIIGDDTIAMELDFQHRSVFTAYFDGAYQVFDVATIMEEDEHGHMWMQTEEGYMVMFDTTGQNPIVTSIKVPNFWDVHDMGDGCILISSYADPEHPNGFYIFQDEELIKFIETERIPRFFKGPKGSAYIADKGKLFKYTHEGLRFILELDYIQDIQFDKEGKEYIWEEAQNYTSHFIQRYKGNMKTIYSSMDVNYDMKVSPNGIIWIASNVGLIEITPSSTSYSSYPFASEESPRAFYYTGNNKHGLNFYDAVPFLAYGDDKRFEVQADLFQAFISDNGFFYGHFLNLDHDMKDLEETFYSIDTNGVLRQLPMEGLDPYDYRLNNDYYGDLYKDQFFLNSNLGAYKYNGNGFTKYPVPLEPTEKHKLELAFGSGSFQLFNLVENHLDFKRKKVVASKIFNYETSTFEDPNWDIDPYMLIRYYGGIGKNFMGKVSQENKVMSRYNGKSSIIDIPISQVNDSLITSIFNKDLWLEDPIVDQNNVYYFPAAIHGLLIFLPEKNEFIQLSEKDGLLSNDLENLFFNPDSTELYMSSYQGLQSVPINELVDGKISNAHSWLRNEGMKELGRPQWINDSVLVMHKEKGYIRLNLAEKKVQKPNLIIQSIEIFNKHVDWNEFEAEWKEEGLFSFPTHFVLPSHQNHLTFEFQGVDHFATNPMKYTYQLVGLDQESIISEYGSVSYQNLPSGEYTFMVVATNDSGSDSRHIEIKFQILKPFYEEAWFIFLCVVSFGLILYTLYYARIRALKHQEEVLKQMVKEKTVELEDEKNFALEQKAIIEEKNREIMDSIVYSKKLQDAILPPLDAIKEALPRSFVFFNPKDVVSGDFYWFERNEDTIFLACADCTGHGVPGAMVSLVCANALNRCVNEFKIHDPAKILNTARKLVIRTFAKSGEGMKDGMDISLCAIKGDQLTFAGAYNPAWIVRNKAEAIPEHERIIELESNDSHKIVQVKADKQPVALFDEMKDFNSTQLELKDGDTVYLFSDGFSDQFGGATGKKLKAPNFRKLLLSYHSFDMKSQREKLAMAFEEWKGQLEQIDDVCVIGVRI